MGANKKERGDYDRPIHRSREDRFTSKSDDIVIDEKPPAATEHPNSTENPWLKLPEVSPFVLPIDSMSFPDWKGTTYELLVDQLPVPFIGAKDAPVVLLTLNPGGRGDPAKYSDDYREECRKRLRFETTVPFMSLDPRFAAMHGARYWQARLRQIIDQVGIEVVKKRLLCLQYFPYQSKTFRALPEFLPSQHYTFGLLREAIRKVRVIVILRSRKLWSRAVPELDNARAIELKNPRSPYLTPKNMPTGDFERIVEALHRG